MKDWTGNKNSIYSCLGASNHTIEDRQEEDYYATDPIAADLLLNEEVFNNKIWECACGEGHLSKIFIKKLYNTKSTDIIDRGFGDVYDFLSIKNNNWDGDIITNPPYKFATEFIEKALDIIPTGNKVAMFLKLTFLEGKKRKKLFEKNPPKVIYVSSSRIQCAKNGDFSNIGSSAVAYGWYVWEKGFQGDPIIKWIN